VWFNAFTGRIYRDAIASPLFHEWMTRVLVTLLNKGSRPTYIDDFQIKDLRFGVMPPILKNIRWLPTSALAAEGADLNYDIAMTADMTYSVSGVADLKHAPHSACGDSHRDTTALHHMSRTTRARFLSVRCGLT
jgi:hypothetical protein